jgi:hypothetical protein
VTCRCSVISELGLNISDISELVNGFSVKISDFSELFQYVLFLLNFRTFPAAGHNRASRRQINQPRQRPPPAPASQSADQKTAEPPPGSSAVCHSRKVASQSR